MNVLFQKLMMYHPFRKSFLKKTRIGFSVLFPQTNGELPYQTTPKPFKMHPIQGNISSKHKTIICNSCQTPCINKPPLAIQRQTVFPVAIQRHILPTGKPRHCKKCQISALGQFKECVILTEESGQLIYSNK